MYIKRVKRLYPKNIILKRNGGIYIKVKLNFYFVYF